MLSSFSLQVKTDDPQKSAVVANTVANVFKQQIKKIMSVNNVTIVSRASTPDEPSFPNKKLFALAGAVLGLILSFLYILIGDLMDTSVGLRRREYVIISSNTTTINGYHG